MDDSQKAKFSFIAIHVKFIAIPSKYALYSLE